MSPDQNGVNAHASQNSDSETPCDLEPVSVQSLTDGAQYVSGMLVDSAQFKLIVAEIARFGPHNTSVLIEGASGTGKELVARALHTFGSFPNGPFVTFNCSNLVDTLAEMQLFGHVKGAFTDARENSLGYFRSANGGTLFLDEIGDLPLRLQPKLLRAVENSEIQPVGSARTYKVDLKLVCATNRHLLTMVKDGSFRPDLYYRLNAAAIVIPPLVDRQGAIPVFVGHFVKHYNLMFGKDIRYISRSALKTMCAHYWPGNIRELGHAVEAAMLQADGSEIRLCDLQMFEEDCADECKQPVEITEMESHGPSPTATKELGAERKEFSLTHIVDAASKGVLLRALKINGGDCQRTALSLGVSRFTVYRMMTRHGLGSPQKYRNQIVRGAV